MDAALNSRLLLAQNFVEVAGHKNREPVRCVEVRQANAGQNFAAHQGYYDRCLDIEAGPKVATIAEDIDRKNLRLQVV